MVFGVLLNQSSKWEFQWTLEFSFPHCRNRQRLWVFTEFFSLHHRVRIELQWPLSFQHSTLPCYFICFIWTSNYRFTEQLRETNSVLKVIRVTDILILKYKFLNTSSLWLFFQSLNLYEKEIIKESKDFNIVFC